MVSPICAIASANQAALAPPPRLRQPCTLGIALRQLATVAVAFPMWQFVTRDDAFADVPKKT